MKHEKSKCCGALVAIKEGEEGTNCYICTGCDKPCDIKMTSGGYSNKLSAPKTKVKKKRDPQDELFAFEGESKEDIDKEINEIIGNIQGE